MTEVIEIKRSAVNANSTEAGPNQVQSVVRAMKIMNCIAEVEDGIHLMELALRVGLAASTTHRLLTSLQQGRYVRFDAERRLWYMGVQAFINGTAFANTRDIATLARPHLRELMKQSDETVNLAVEDRGEMIFLLQVECRHLVRALAGPGARTPIYCSASGKAILAAMNDGQLNKILQRIRLHRLTPRTITTPAALHRELREVRQLGYAIDNEEHSMGVRCVGAAIYNEHREVFAAVSISGLASRIPDEKLVELGALVKARAQLITAEIGGRQPEIATG
ncbi:MAG TPA: IclR family transcriptional regulator C-terminal domain-containing protein [Aliidongia sp.]|nr:IclR family transcriptional regulator C-terminal domain-containing protein [Aliidongia sp.]